MNSPREKFPPTPADAAPPPAPRTLAETGLDEQFLVELLAKVLYQRGNLALVDLAQHVRLSATLIEEMLGFMRAERIVELRRRGASAGDAEYGLTEQGRARAADFVRKCRYAGPAPVTLGEYTAQVHRQSIADMKVTHGDVERAYRSLVVAQELRDRVGTAMNSGRPLFLYGPAGSGKTYLAESLVRLLHGAVAIPHALVVDGEIIQMFDPMVHRRVQTNSAESPLDNRARADGRWVMCERPVVVSGGELTLDMLNLQYDPSSGLYHAPAHLKANNGLYVVDDLGRQQARPEQIMNRWIVPMEYRRDHMGLHTGSSFEIPFDVKLVFSTNLAPEDVADEAFLRRLGCKIHIGPMSETEYREVFERVCTDYGLGDDKSVRDKAFGHLLGLHRHHDRHTVACYPRDILSLVRDYATYREVPPSLAPELIEWAWQSYFATQ